MENLTTELPSLEERVIAGKMCYGSSKRASGRFTTDDEAFGQICTERCSIVHNLGGVESTFDISA